MVDVVNEQVEEGEVLLLCPPCKLVMVIQRLAILGNLVLGFEPGGENLGVQADLGCDVERKLDDTGFDIGAETYAIGARYAHEQVGQTTGEAVVLNKSLLLALDQGCKKENGLLYNPLVEGARGNLGDWHIDLLRSGEGDAWMGEGAAGLVAENTGELLQPDLDDFGGVIIVGEVR